MVDGSFYTATAMAAGEKSLVAIGCSEHFDFEKSCMF